MPVHYSIVIPAYNENARIGRALTDVLRAIEKNAWNAEVLIVNDGSTDDSMQVLDQNLETLRNFKPLSEDQISALCGYGKQFDDGRYELFKSTVKYDGDLGRQQHNFPPATDLPA